MKDRSRLKFANSFVDRGAHRRGFEPAHVFFFPSFFYFSTYFPFPPRPLAFSTWFFRLCLVSFQSKGVDSRGTARFKWKRATNKGCGRVTLRQTNRVSFNFIPPLRFDFTSSRPGGKNHSFAMFHKLLPCVNPFLSFLFSLSKFLRSFKPLINTIGNKVKSSDGISSSNFFNFKSLSLFFLQLEKEFSFEVSLHHTSRRPNVTQQLQRSRYSRLNANTRMAD